MEPAATEQIYLETERLTLREMTEADAEDMFLLNSDPEVIRYTGDEPFKTVEEARELARNYPQYRLYRQGRLLLHLKSTGEFIGWCGLKFYPELQNHTDLGYRLLKKHWGKGYATEVSRICLDYGFRTLGLKKIVAWAMPANTASVKIMQKLGMKPEPSIAKEKGCYLQYGITQQKWLQGQPSATAAVV